MAASSLRALSQAVFRQDRPHTKALTSPYQGGPARAPLKPEEVPWKNALPGYKPVDYTAAVVLKGPVWADDVTKLKTFKWHTIDNGVDRQSAHDYAVDKESNLPLNPMGRTGMVGRGLLGRFGPNHAADPLVTRWKRHANGEIMHNAKGQPIMQFVSIQRRDTGEWALPGGMVDPGEEVSLTVKREFGEEALNSLERTPEELAEIKAHVDDIFKHGEVVYRGYVDDPRNTDNAWMETTAINIHDNNGEAFGAIPLQAGDDAGAVRWQDYDESANLYASHQKMLEVVFRYRCSQVGAL